MTLGDGLKVRDRVRARVQVPSRVAAVGKG